jgi:hypothetical protein
VDAVLVYFDETIDGPDGANYAARACTRELDDSRWAGWLEFSRNGADWVATDTETVQPNRRDVEYWVTGLTRVYLQGALGRALGIPLGSGAHPRLPDDVAPPRHVNRRAPNSTTSSNVPRTILDPFSVYAQGESILRAQLGALSPDQLRNIAAAFNIESPETASTLDASELRERVVLAARGRLSRPADPELRA